MADDMTPMERVVVAEHERRQAVQRAEQAETERDALHEQLRLANIDAVNTTAELAEIEAERDAVLRHDEEAVRQLNAAEADIGAWRDSWRRERDRLGQAEAERDALKAATEDVAEAIRQARRIMACSSRDWSVHPDDAWLYALIVGWDCEIPEHVAGHDPIDCSGPNHLEAFAERFGWTEGGIAKLRAQRQAIAALDHPTDKEPEEDDQWRRDEREIDGGFSGCELPRLWPPRRRHPTDTTGETETP